MNISTPKLLLVNVDTHENTGDAARQFCICESLLTNIPDAKITIITPDPYTRHSIQERLGEKVKVINVALPSTSVPLCFRPNNIPALFRAYSIADVIISTGGIFGHLSSLFPLLLGLLFQKPIVICGSSTYGPIKKRLHRFIATQILNRVSVILVREAVSKNHLENLGLTSPQIRISADPAFLMKDGDNQEIDMILREEGLAQIKPLIGINISRWPTANDDSFKKYQAAMIELVNYLTEEIGAFVVFLPFCFVNGYDDRIENQQIADSIRNQEKVKIVSRTLEPATVRGIMKSLSLFIGTRYHSNLMALSKGIPTLALSYHHKMSGTMEIAGMAEWTCDLSTLDLSCLLNKITAIWEVREDIRAKLNESIRIIEDKASLNIEMIKQLLVAEDK